MLKKNKIKNTMEALMKKNITNKILMVRPALFAFNEETAVNNYYQKRDNKTVQEIQNSALI